MRLFRAVTLLLLMCGSLAQARVVAAGLAPDDVTTELPAPAVSSSLQLPLRTANNIAFTPASVTSGPDAAISPVPQDLEPLDRSLLLSVDPEAEEAAEGGADATALVNEPAKVDTQLESAPPQDVVDEELSEVEPLDPETIEETRVLTDQEAIPPDDEGVSVPTNEVVFDFPVVENQKVQYFIDYFTGDGRKVFARWMERTTRHLPYMQDVFASYGLPRDLVYLSIVESGLNPKAYSWAHASGPWQFIGSTGKIFGLENDYWWDERRDFEKSTVAAARYLKELHELFNGNWYLAVAAYNAGAGKVMRAVRATGSRDFWEIARTRYLKEETKNYVPKLLAVLLIAKQPEKYGFTDLQYLTPVDCDKVLLPAMVDLEVVARLTDSNYEQIKALNPELKRWCTPPKAENYEIKIPSGTKDVFLLGYDALQPDERIGYKYHKLAKGETLKSLAKTYNIGVDDILAVNSIGNPKSLKVGRGLVLPLRKGMKPIPLEDLREDPIQVKLAASKTYKVRKGDTLWKISRRSGVSEKNLRAWNGLKTKSTLRIGQVLRLGPGKGKGSATTFASTKQKSKKSSVAKSATKTVQKSASRKNSIVYKVRKGDTLDKIARQYDVSSNDIRSWNDLPKRHILQPGDNLTLRVQGRRGG